MERDTFNSLGTLIGKNPPILALEPEVAFEEVPWQNFTASVLYDYVILSKSPGFTPVESDQLIPVIEDYIEGI